ncbi:3'-5' exonuclease [Citrobacter amalonaticus]|nr:3'-5' exonuclease [Citrobacter amalonaticus]
MRWLKPWEGTRTPEQKRRKIMPSPAWPDALKHYLRQPLPDETLPITQMHFVALDFETTGLNAAEDKILSMGMVDFTLEDIDIASSEELYINHSEFIRPETAKVNGLTPQSLAQGIALDEGINRLLERIRGKVIVAHSSNIENAFIQAYFSSQYQLKELPTCFIDTLYIEQKFSYAGISRAHSSYQLDDLRRHYNLPEYLLHSAASDALACAELFLVQSKKIDALPGISLKRLMR